MLLSGAGSAADVDPRGTRIGSRGGALGVAPDGEGQVVAGLEADGGNTWLKVLPPDVRQRPREYLHAIDE